MRTFLYALQALISISTIGTQSDVSDAQLAEKCREEMAEWFGADEVASWKLLRVYRIPYAQPNQVMFLRLDCKLSIHCDLMYGRFVSRYAPSPQFTRSHNGIQVSVSV